MANRRLFKAASYLILEKDNKILFLRRFNTGYMDGSYSFPAGHLEEGENAQSCIIREAKEEIGITIKDPQFVCVVESAPEYFTLFFTVSNWEGEIKICEVDKCDDMQWFAKDALPQSMPPEVESAIQNYLKKRNYSHT